MHKLHVIQNMDAQGLSLDIDGLARPEKTMGEKKGKAKLFYNSFAFS